MRGSSSDRSSSSLKGYSDQIIKRTEKERQVGRSQKRRKWRRGSFTSISNDGKRSNEEVERGAKKFMDVGSDTGADHVTEEPRDDSVAELVRESVDSYIISGDNKNSQLSAIYDAPRYPSTQHRLAARSSGSSNGPLIIGTTVGSVSFIGILIIAIVIWRRRLIAKERQFAIDNQAVGGAGRALSIITAPSASNNDEDKVADLGMVYRSPVSTYGTGASRSSSINNRSRSTPASPIDKSQIRHHSWTQDENLLGSPTPPAIAQAGGRIPSRATTPMSVVSSSTTKKPKRSSSILQRFGSRDLSSPASLQTLSSNRGPPPPRPPRPDEIGVDDEESAQAQVFELSANPSVKKKRNSKPLPVLPTFLAREHEEEMKRRKAEWEKERKEQYENMRRPQSPVDDQPPKTTPPPPASSSAFASSSNQTGIRLKPEGAGHKKVLSLDSLASTTTSSSINSGDEDETPGGTRRPTPEVNALSPRSSQRRPERRMSELRPPIPSFAHTDVESVATGGDSLMKRTSYLIADGPSGVEATAVAPGFPSPKLVGKLRLTPPLSSSASLHSSSNNSNSSVLSPIQAPVSATVAKPPPFPLSSPQLLEESSGTHTRTESTSSSGVAATGEHQDSLRTFMLADNPSDRALAYSSIEDWRESVGETYAATRPPTAGAGSTRSGQRNVEDVSGPSVVVPLRPAFPRRISVDTGVAHMRPPPPPAAVGGGAFLTPSTATTSSGGALSPYSPIDQVPISAITPPSNSKRETLRPSTPEQRREADKASTVIKRKLVPAVPGTVDEGVKSWLNVGNDSEEDVTSASHSAAPDKR